MEIGTEFADSQHDTGSALRSTTVKRYFCTERDCAVLLFEIETVSDEVCVEGSWLLIWADIGHGGHSIKVDCTLNYLTNEYQTF